MLGRRLWARYSTDGRGMLLAEVTLFRPVRGHGQLAIGLGWSRYPSEHTMRVDLGPWQITYWRATS